jgi:hypothetical protein
MPLEPLDWLKSSLVAASIRVYLLQMVHGPCMKAPLNPEKTSESVCHEKYFACRRRGKCGQFY